MTGKNKKAMDEAMAQLQTLLGDSTAERIGAGKGKRLLSIEICAGGGPAKAEESEDANEEPGERDELLERLMTAARK